MNPEGLEGDERAAFAPGEDDHELATSEHLAALYDYRFPAWDRAGKRKIWAVLCRDYFQRYVRDDDTVVDLAAGYCEFINQIHARRKIAVDLNPDIRRHASADVEVILENATELPSIPVGTVDVVFMSNFLEHLPSRSAVLAVLDSCHRILRPGGRVLVLQPNIRVLGRRYWDFFDHLTPISDRSLAEALHLAGFTVETLVPRFLPYTMRSRLPQSPTLVALYLRAPVAWRLLGRQAFAVARR